MDKNVLVDQSSTNSIATTIPSPSCFSSDIKGKTTTTNSSFQQLSSVPSSSGQKNNIGDSEMSIPLSVGSSNRETMISSSSSTSKFKSEVDQLDDLVQDLLTEVNRPLPSMNERHSSDRQSSTNEIRSTREETNRMKNRTNFDSNRNSSNPIQTNISASIDEQLIDSLLESVQNTLKRRAQQLSIDQNHSQTRRAHSSSSAYNDSLHRIDPGRAARFPIKINRTDSPTSTISSRRAQSRDGYFPSSTTKHFRATSEPPPEGPIELRRIDLVRSPSRTYFDGPPVDYYYYYPRSTLPYRAFRPRYYDYSGYESDNGSINTRFYPNRFSRIPNRIFPQQTGRADGYDTDSGLISSGRLRMSRPSPSSSARMAAIPETYIVQNRMFSSSNFDPPSNQTRFRHENYPTGFDLDSKINQRKSHDFHAQPVQIQREDFDREHLFHRQIQPEPFYQNTSSIPIHSESKNQKPVVDINVPISKASTATTTKSSTVENFVKQNDSTTEMLEENKTETATIDRQPVRNDGPYQAHNVSQFWYKEKMSRDDAIQVLKNKPPGSFLVRDSQGFPGSFGLAVKVDKLPANIQPKTGIDPTNELVRHYLIERTPTGHVRLKGCPNEPDFLNLSELVFHHTLAPLALPIKLILPQKDITENFQPTASEAKKMTIKTLLEKGAACNVVYLNIVDVESLSGAKAVAKALNETFGNVENLQPTIVNFKVSTNGITLLDTKKRIFSRRHFPKENVFYCGGDFEEERFWTHQFSDVETLPKAKCFAFVSKKTNDERASGNDFECHVFAELDPGQPANVIVNFVSKVLIGSVPV